MHKIFLTASEVSIIHGAEPIIAKLGGFPSMENGKLYCVNIKNSKQRYSRYDISLIFDIGHWADVSSRYIDIPKFPQRFVALSFQGARDIWIDSPNINECGEFKFGNTPDRTKMHQDVLPSESPFIERPFCTFYMRNGRDFVIDFDEDECLISAMFMADM